VWIFAKLLSVVSLAWHNSLHRAMFKCSSGAFCVVLCSGDWLQFFTVHVYTCARSCWSADAEVVEEFTIVEYDHYGPLLDERMAAAAAAAQKAASSQDPLHQSTS